MPRVEDTAEDILQGLHQDVLWLLITIYSYMERARFDGIRDMSREHFSIEAILLESASRDIVSRLAALDDDGRGNRSFQTLFSALKREGLGAARTAALDRKVKAYRRSVNDLKVDHRNRYIAHVGTEAGVKPRVLDDPVECSETASLAVNLLDEFAGRTIPYFFKLGSDGRIDLRAALAPD